MIKRFVVTIALAIVPLAAPQHALACSCIAGENQAYFNNADLVLQGVPLDKQVDGQTHRYSVAVEKVWKGKVDAYVDIVTADNDAACGVTMEIDKRIIIFAYQSDGVYHTDICSGTKAANNASDLTNWLNGDKEQPSCAPYICPNGDTFPTCTEDGHTINYLVEPCRFAKEPANGFSDVPESHPNFAAITYVKEQGMVQGYDDGTYGPDLFINRAEFTKIILEATVDSNDIDTCESSDLFSDVTQSDWFGDYVCMAKQTGVIGGYPDGSFKPANSINFAEAAKIVVVAFDIPFAKDDIWWKPYVFALARIGGLPSSFSDPNQQLTRGDMAEIIYRVKMGM